MAKIAVAPLVGAWIEISCMQNGFLCWSVAPLVGAWIEILQIKIKVDANNVSLPSWERGLKSAPPAPLPEPLDVAPLVGAWIEISSIPSGIFIQPCRSPRGSVD